MSVDLRCKVSVYKTALIVLKEINDRITILGIAFDWAE